MSVQKAIDLTGSGETIQDAVSEALDRARESLEGITTFEVQRISGVVEESSHDLPGRAQGLVHRAGTHARMSGTGWAGSRTVGGFGTAGGRSTPVDPCRG